MVRAHEFLQALLQVQRMANAHIVGARDLSKALQDRLCRAVQIDTFEDLTTTLETTCADVTALFLEKLGKPATENEM